MTFLIVFFCSIAFTMAVTPVLISRAPSWGLLDHPDDRKIHKMPMPLVGGPVLFPLVLIGLSMLLAGTQSLPFILIGVTAVFALGVVDDLKGVHFSTKFFVQIIAALLVIQTGALFNLNKTSFLEWTGLHFAPIASTAVTLVWIVGITNAVNLIDGMDGLASGLCLNATIGIGAIAILSGRSDLALMCAFLAGGLLGFLRYNTVPARTYLGDSGSMMLGFTLAVMSILQSAKTSTFLVLVIPVLLLAIPMADTSLAFMRRALRGRNPFEPDRYHLHHKLLDLNFSVKQTLGIFYSFSAALGIMALWFFDTKNEQIIALALVCLIAAIALIKVMQVLNLHEPVRRINTRIRIIAKRAVSYEWSNGRMQTRNMSLLVVLSVLNLVLVMRNIPFKGLFITAIAGLFLIGLMDFVLGRREVKPRYEVQHNVILLSIVLNQFIVLILMPAGVVRSPVFSAASVAIFAVVGLFLFRTGMFATFLLDPAEILGLFIALVVFDMFKYDMNSQAVVPFALVIFNALVIYALFKVYLTGYPIRSRYVMAGMAVFFIVMAGVTWV